MLISRGDILVFIKHPISAVFVSLCVILIAVQIYLWVRRTSFTSIIKAPVIPSTPSEAEP